MQMVNRNSFVVKPKQSYVDWINAQPDQDTLVSLADIHRDCTTYLIPEMIGEEDAQKYIRAFKLKIFTIELEAWYRDPNVWPKKRTLAMFDEWFDLEFHSMIMDLDKTLIIKE